MGSKNIRIELLVDELNNLYVELFKLYNQTNPFLGKRVDKEGLVSCYCPERIEKAEAEVEALTEKAKTMLDELRKIIEE